MEYPFHRSSRLGGLSAEHGFWDGASKKMGAMRLGRDVGEQPARIG
jgi:hypothetical protein